MSHLPRPRPRPSRRYERWWSAGPRSLLAGLAAVLTLLSLGLATPPAFAAAAAATHSPARPPAPIPHRRPGLTPVVRSAVRHDLSPPLRTIKPVHIKHTGKLRAIPFPQPHPQKSATSSATFVPPASTVRTSHVQTRMGATSMPTFGQNFEGINLNGDNDPCGCYPPDTNMAVGPSDIVQTVNTAFAVYSKQGQLLLGPEDLGALWQGLGGVCDPATDPSSYDGGDPIVMYDEAANRWFISQLSYPGGTQGYHECMAVSQTGDPTGAYYRYDFLFSSDTLNDYPKFGVWPDGYYFSADDFLNGQSFEGVTVIAFNRQAMLAGQQAQSVSFTISNPNIIYLVPSSTEGAALGETPPAGAPDPYFMSCDPNSPDVTATCTQNQIDEWDFHVDWSNPANSTFGNNGAPNQTLPTDTYNGNLCNGSNSCIPQPGTSSTLEPSADHLMYRAAYRDIGGTPTIVLSQTVNVSSSPPTTTQAGVNWYELADTGSGWTISQQGTYAPDGGNRWMPDANIDAAGDIAIGYSVDNAASLYPSIAVAGRLAGDPAGQLSQGEEMMFTGSNSQSASRWGDYSAMQVDPSDGCTFWYTQEYAGTTGSVDWKTRIGSFKYPSCSTTPPGTVSGSVTDAGTGKPVANATVAFAGGTVNTSTFTDSQGGYSAMLPPGTYTETVSAFGYTTQTISNVRVTSGQTTTENEALPEAPTVHLTGTVTDGSGHGWPLYASIKIAGDPNGPFWTNPATGKYSIALPENASYSVTYTPTLPGYQAATDSVAVGASDATHNASVPVDTSCTAPGYQSQSGTCAPVPGGLVVGTVRDANTGAAVNGAAVTSGDNPSDTTTTVATPGDPAVGGGYYQMFSSLTGSHPFTVSKSLANGAGYTPTTQNVDVAADSATDAEFTAKAGQLSVSPAAVSQTLVLGKSATATVEITNTGTAPATFNLGERLGAAQVLTAQIAATPGTALRRVRLPRGEHASPGWMGRELRAAKRAKSAKPATGSSSTSAWSTIADYPDNTGVQDNAAAYLDGNLYSVGGINSSQILNTTAAYNVYTNTWTQLANMPVAREKPGAAFVNGKLYVTGGWSTVNTNGYPVARTDVYDPASNTWSNVSDNPYPTAASGVAVAGGQIYFVGGCLDAACDTGARVVRYDPANDTWQTVASYPHPVAWESCGGIGGKVYCAGGTDGSNTYSDAYVYDPSTDAWSPIASLPADLWGAAGGAANGLLVMSTGVTSGGNVITNQGYAYDPSTNTWSALPNAQYPVLRAGGACGFYKIGGDTSGNFTPTPSSEGLSGLDQCGTTNVPWLSGTPAHATLQPGQSAAVSVTVSATSADGIDQPGTYTAQLAVSQSTPYPVAPVNVTMTATPPIGWGDVAGTVTGVSCSATSAPLHGAFVQASGKNNFAVTLYTGPDGKYTIWAPAADNPITLTVSMSGYGTQVQKVRIKSGKTITASFSLAQLCG